MSFERADSEADSQNLRRLGRAAQADLAGRASGSQKVKRDDRRYCGRGRASIVSKALQETQEKLYHRSRASRAGYWLPPSGALFEPDDDPLLPKSGNRSDGSAYAAYPLAFAVASGLQSETIPHPIRHVGLSALFGGFFDLGQFPLREPNPEVLCSGFRPRLLNLSGLLEIFRHFLTPWYSTTYGDIVACEE